MLAIDQDEYSPPVIYDAGDCRYQETDRHAFMHASRRKGMPRLVFRGIRTLDQFKNDNFHRFSASMAAVSAVDFIEQGLNLPEGVAVDQRKQLPPGYAGLEDKIIRTSVPPELQRFRRPLVSEVIASVGDVGWVW
jgi:hypothetical protein